MLCISIKLYFTTQYSSGHCICEDTKNMKTARTYQFTLAPLAESAHDNSDTQAEGEDTGDYDYLTGWSS